ncbi:N-methyl-L-tryptophan oxidase [Actinomadura sp. HBU206391]|uniref:N-methyl-L-tryptophan oxidase n=1 Tax=Actinomadura sp. HBU206391 TaxID=2731692 RepID=UPI00165029E9|nr:N-methyl-L-tryptophan oxidase [Actinomadura sp. HBU206391]MBC6457188.1 N-methyl-L-tryptophan oxidase [Actinomadura sp. HBU206391]
MTRVDVVVVGLGLTGSAAAWALSRRGRSVVAFEAFQPDHRRGSSHGRSRIFRRAYTDRLYVELTGRAGELWRLLERESGESLLHRTGGLDHGAGGEPEAMAALLADAGVPAELIPPDEAARRWPGMSFEGPVLFHPEAGVIDPERAMAAMTRLATSAGARISYGTWVDALEPQSDGGVLVRTGSGSLHARTVVVAAGPWTEPLLSGLVKLPRLTVTQQQVFFFRPHESAVWPTFIREDDDAVYGLPEGPLLKVAEHGRGRVTTAEDRDGVVDPASRERVMSFVRRWLPGVDPAPCDELTCLYTSTDGEDFILDRQGPIVVCSPCSGHGAKFTPLVGEIAADLADGHPPIHERFTLAAHERPSGRDRRANS